MKRVSIILFAGLNSALNATKTSNCGAQQPVLPLQYLCPNGDSVGLNDLTSNNWRKKSCSGDDSSSSSRRRRSFTVGGQCVFYNPNQGASCPGDTTSYVSGSTIWCTTDTGSDWCTGRSSDSPPGEDPLWLNREDQAELKMMSPYNLVVNIVNIESTGDQTVEVDGIGKASDFVKSMVYSLFPTSQNAKYTFIMEASNTAEVYETVKSDECPSKSLLQNGMLALDEAWHQKGTQKAIPTQLPKSLGYDVESWDQKFSNLLGYLNETVTGDHKKIAVNHFQFARNSKIDQSQVTKARQALSEWRTETMQTKGLDIDELKLVFHFIGDEAGKSFDELEKSSGGQLQNKQSVEFTDSNSNKIRALEYGNDQLHLTYKVGESDKPDALPIFHIIKSFLDYDSYFDLNRIKESGLRFESDQSGGASSLAPLLMSLMMTLTLLLF